MTGGGANEGTERGLAAEAELFGDGGKGGGSRLEQFYSVFQSNFLNLFVEGHSVALFQDAVEMAHTDMELVCQHLASNVSIVVQGEKIIDNTQIGRFCWDYGGGRGGTIAVELGEQFQQYQRTLVAQSFHMQIGV